MLVRAESKGEYGNERLLEGDASGCVMASWLKSVIETGPVCGCRFEIGFALLDEVFLGGELRPQTGYLGQAGPPCCIR
jgi:hypothetical protein